MTDVDNGAMPASPEEAATPAAPPPIRGMRTMAVVRWLILLAMAALAAGTWWIFVIREPPNVEGPDRYYCPMHPQIRSPVPGTCPICFMNLEPIPHDEPPTSAATADRDGGVAADASAERVELAPVMLTTERRQRSGIATVPVIRVDTAARLRWPAVVEAREGGRAEVRVRAAAFVERLAVRDSGARVRAGQPLAWIYSPEIVRAQEELLNLSRWRTTGTSDDPARAAGSGIEAAARRRLELLGVSSTDIEAVVASGQSRRTVALRAPISGYVTELGAVLGAYAMPETVLYQITDLDRVRVVASAFADDLVAGAPPQTGRFRARGSDRAIDVRLDLVEPQIDPRTRTASLRYSADNEGLTLRPGDIGEIEIERPPTPELVVPRDAIIDTGTSQYVFVERDDGVFEPRVIELGPLRGEHRVVRSGLDAGERVVARGAFVLDSESRLQAALAPLEDRPPATPPGQAHPDMEGM